MIEKLIYTNARGDSVEFSANSVYHCNVSKDVTGLADVKSTIYTSSSVNQHGDTYLGERIEARDIDINGAINCRDKAKTIEYRRKLARILNPEIKGTLTYIFGEFRRVIAAKPENAPVITQKGVFMNYVVQFCCFSPFWQEETETKEDIAAWVSALEFDTEIDETECMIFGYRELSVIVNCYNKGDVSTGMRIEFKALQTVETPQLLNIHTREYVQINTTLLAGDVVTINTEYGQKGITLTRDGQQQDYFRYIDVDSTFMQLEVGDNQLRYDAATGIDNIEVSIYHNSKYLGV